MRPVPRIFGNLAVVGLVALAAPAFAQDAGPRIAGMSATLGATEFQATALVTGTPARVVFEIVPNVTPAPAPTRVTATRRPARPEAVTAFGPTVADWSARLPAPARFGAFTGRALAFDAAGHEVARSEAAWVRPFPAHVTITPAAPVLDVSAAAGDALFAIDVTGAQEIDALAVQTSAHVSAELGFGELPYEAAQDARVTLPRIAVQLVRRGPTRFEVHVAVPAATPPRTLGIDRVYLRSATGHATELSIQDDRAVIQVTSDAPRPAALDVVAGRERADLIVTFRYQGPVVGRARRLYDFPIPNVEARVRDHIRSVRGRCTPLENPLGDPPWGGESMTCRLHTTTRGGHPLQRDVRLQIVAGRELLGEVPLAEVLR